MNTASMSDIVRFRVPPGIADAVVGVAASEGMNLSEWLRDAVGQRLAEKGIAVPQRRRRRSEARSAAVGAGE